MEHTLAELLGEMLGPRRQPRRKPQRYPHKARLDADERALADAHGLEVWRDFKPVRGCCPCGYNVYRAGTHPGRAVVVSEGKALKLGWDDVHRSEVFELLRVAAGLRVAWVD